VNNDGEIPNKNAPKALFLGGRRCWDRIPGRAEGASGRPAQCTGARRLVEAVLLRSLRKKTREVEKRKAAAFAAYDERRAHADKVRAMMARLNDPERVRPQGV
jgi:hypothetical protein